jgi:hypothetical protein
MFAGLDFQFLSSSSCVEWRRLFLRYTSPVAAAGGGRTAQIEGLIDDAHVASRIAPHNQIQQQNRKEVNDAGIVLVQQR